MRRRRRRSRIWGEARQTGQHACELIRGLHGRQVLAARAYDADSLCALIAEQGGEPVIPPHRHRKVQRGYDHIAYKQRWGVEGFFAKLKQWRRIAPR